MSTVHPYIATGSEQIGDVGAHILVVDDQADIRNPMTAYLQRCGFSVVAVENGTQMRAHLSDGSACDLILLDVMLPGEDGFSLCRYVQQERATPVILLTAMGETAQRVQGLESGADDYVVKPFEPTELVARIRSVLRRSQRSALPAQPATAAPVPAAPWRFRFDAWTFDAQRRELRHDAGAVVDLSAAEYRLLSVLVARPHTVLSRDQLLDLTSDGEADVFDRSIDTQVSRLRRKMEVNPRSPRLLKTAWGNGYLFAASVEVLA